MSRDNSTEEDARKRITAQMPMAVKRARASDIIDNSGIIEETRSQTLRLIEQLNSSWLPWLIRLGILAFVLIVGYLVSMLMNR
jgi:dephospho-CoA kinase